jgi:hypothetical protein
LPLRRRATPLDPPSADNFGHKQPPNDNASGPLRFRVEQAIQANSVDACYNSELARDFAIAYASDPEVVIEADNCESRLKAKYPDLNLIRFRRGVRAFRDQFAQAATGFSGVEGWEAELIRHQTKDGPGAPAPCVTNAMLYLENHEDWAGRMKWNSFTGEALVVKDLPPPVNLKKDEPVKDHHDTLVQSWFERETRDYKWSIDTVRRSVECWMKAHSFNPVHDYLNGLPAWDGVERLPSWLMTYCGAGMPDDDSAAALKLNDFISAIGERWWISAIARAFDPGCKVHHVLVLEGAKGIGKTTLAEIIFGKYYAVILGDVSSKDNQALMSAGVWGVLLDELDVLGKSEMRSVKSWVTRDFEKFRPTWGHRHETRQRQCVFIANVNGDDWALEEDRRWWPVACRKAFDLIGLRRDRDLLMAEALHKFRSGVRWHFDAEEDATIISTAKVEQAARVPDNVLGKTFLDAAEHVAENQMVSALIGSASVAEILQHLNIPLDRRKGLQQDVGKSLRAAGWTIYQPRDGKTQSRRWRNFERYPKI